MPEQLALRAGQVRCGQCKTVFDGDRAANLALGAHHTESAAPSEAALGPPTVTLRAAGIDARARCRLRASAIVMPSSEAPPARR